jgi:hypothetical protein
MTSTNPPEYSTEEQLFKETLESQLTVYPTWSHSPEEIKILVESILNEAIEKAEKLGLRGVNNLGDEKIKNKEFLEKRLKAGLTKEDILGWWNRPYVWILMEWESSRWLIQNTIEMFVSKKGLIQEEAIKRTRKFYPNWGDPEKSQEPYLKDDANIYPEFLKRYEAWRLQYPIKQEEEIKNNYSTCNAMIRDLVKKGQLNPAEHEEEKSDSSTTIEKTPLIDFRLQVMERIKSPLTERGMIAIDDFWTHFEKIQAGFENGEISVLIDPMWLSANHPEYGRPYFAWMTYIIYTLGIILLFLIPPIGIAILCLGFIYSIQGKRGGRDFTKKIVRGVIEKPSSGGMADLAANYISLTLGLSSNRGYSKWPIYPSCVFLGGKEFMPEKL